MRGTPVYLSVLILVLATISLAGERAGAATDGDVDCNGRIDSIDASLVLQRTSGLIGTFPCAVKADVNSDGATNSVDALFILQFNARLISAFPQCDATARPSNAQQTIDGAGPGTTICLQSGAYGTLFFYRKFGIELLGAGADNSMTGGDTCLLVIESQNVTISDVGARNCTVQGAFAGDSTGIVFRRVEAEGGPIGFQYQRSSGRIEDSSARNHGSFGAILQLDSNVTLEDTALSGNDIGLINQDNTIVRFNGGSVTGNNGGLFTLKQTGRTVIDGARISGNELNVFAGVPGCADLPPADPNPPQCFLDNPAAFVSQVRIEISDTTIRGSSGPGVVLFPGVTATLTRSTIADAGLTGLFAWGARLAAAGNTYDNNVENAIECRAYPGPSASDRGMCELTFEHIHDSEPLSGNRLGGGFVSEGGEFRLTRSTIEDNWGIGVQVLHGGKGVVSDTTIRNNGGTAFCISGETWVTLTNNMESANRPGSCLGHP